MKERCEIFLKLNSRKKTFHVRRKNQVCDEKQQTMLNNKACLASTLMRTRKNIFFLQEKSKYEKKSFHKFSTSMLLLFQQTTMTTTKTIISFTLSTQ